MTLSITASFTSALSLTALSLYLYENRFLRLKWSWIILPFLRDHIAYFSVSSVPVTGSSAINKPPDKTRRFSLSCTPAAKRSGDSVLPSWGASPNSFPSRRRPEGLKRTMRISPRLNCCLGSAEEMTLWFQWDPWKRRRGARKRETGDEDWALPVQGGVGGAGRGLLDITHTHTVTLKYCSHKQEE